MLAALWTLADFARAYVLTGFPWGLVGYAWVETPVIQAVALFGPHVLGLLTLVAALLPGLGPGRALAAAAALVAAGWGFGAWRLAEPAAGAAGTAGGAAGAAERGAGAEVAARAWQQEFYERHLALTRGEPAAGRDHLVGDGGALPARAARRSCSPKPPAAAGARRR